MAQGVGCSDIVFPQHVRNPEVRREALRQLHLVAPHNLKVTALIVIRAVWWLGWALKSFCVWHRCWTTSLRVARAWHKSWGSLLLPTW